ncbi:hypothetical protein AAC387_Pa07g2114 [Persea americana]
MVNHIHPVCAQIYSQAELAENAFTSENENVGGKNGISSQKSCLRNLIREGLRKFPRTLEFVKKKRGVSTCTRRGEESGGIGMKPKGKRGIFGVFGVGATDWNDVEPDDNRPGLYPTNPSCVGTMAVGGTNRMANFDLLNSNF